MTNKLLLGSGEWHWPDWITIDADAANHPDLVATVPPLPDIVQAQTWDTIMGIHVIEHIVPWLVPDLLTQCYDCLKIGGVLILEQPNILYAAKVLLGEVVPPAGEHGQFDMWPLYGNPNDHNEWMLHRWGYTPFTLMERLVGAGFIFEKITQKPAEFHQPVRDFRIEARK